MQVVARKPGVVAGGPVARRVFARLDPRVTWTEHLADGSRVEPGDVIASVSGPLRSLLTGERTALNFLTHLSGIATLTAGTSMRSPARKARILDTRKTHPGYRVLEKYAVRCGGGTNHRMGLYDGVLIKDNHLAGMAASTTRHDARGRGASLPRRTRELGAGRSRGRHAGATRRRADRRARDRAARQHVACADAAGGGDPRSLAARRRSWRPRAGVPRDGRRNRRDGRRADQHQGARPLPHRRSIWHSTGSVAAGEALW